MSQFQNLEMSSKPIMTAFGTESLISLFEKSVKLNPNKAAIFHEDQSIRYKDLNCEANSIAYYLSKMGIKEGKVVTILLERSIDLVSSIIGVLKTGAAYTVVDPDSPLSRIEYILKDTNSDILLTEITYEEHPKYKDLLEAHRRKVIYLAEYLADADNHPQNPLIKSHGGTLACIIYTSGSTGKPKGVLLNHKSFYRLFDGPNMVQLASTDVLAQIAHASFDLSIFDIWSVLSVGAMMIIINKEKIFSPEDLKECFKYYKVTTILFPAALFHQLVRIDPSVILMLRNILLAGEEPNPEIVRYILNNKTGPQRIFNLYGPAECGVFATYYEVKTLEPEAKSIPIGMPVNDTEIFILNEKLKMVEPGEPGELYLLGGGLARGYVNLPELTFEKFIISPFHEEEKEVKLMYKTGDWVQMLPSGDLDFLGRIDNQVKVRGFRVELDEIEMALDSHQDVLQSVVVAPYTPEGHRQLVAYLIPKTSTCVLDLNGVDGVKSFVAKTLPEYMLPNIMIQLEAFPLNEHGKVDRQTLMTKHIALIQ